MIIISAAVPRGLRHTTSDAIVFRVSFPEDRASTGASIAIAMNHIPSHILSEGAQPMSRRTLAKQRTRQALISAAKALFTAHGYADATVRGIAKATGMSTGAVFANFSDKSDLFGEILADDYEQLSTTMREIAGLQDKGVRFEHYDMPGMTRDGDIHRCGDRRVAWFKDPDGNILSLVSG